MANSRVHKRRACPSAAMLDEYGAAERLGLSVATLRRWRWAGRGPEYVKLCAAVRYELRVLNAWLAQCRRSSTSDTGEAE